LLMILLQLRNQELHKKLPQVSSKRQFFLYTECFLFIRLAFEYLQYILNQLKFNL